MTGREIAQNISPSFQTGPLNHLQFSKTVSEVKWPITKQYIRCTWDKATQIECSKVNKGNKYYSPY